MTDENETNEFDDFELLNESLANGIQTVLSSGPATADVEYILITRDTSDPDEVMMGFMMNTQNDHAIAMITAGLMKIRQAMVKDIEELKKEGDIILPH